MTRSRLNTWFERVEDDIQISMELDSTETMKRFVKAGLGICFLAASNCREDVAAGTLRSLPLAPDPMIRKLGLIYRKDKALSKAALGFIHVILGHFGAQAGCARPPLAPAHSGSFMTCPRCYAEFEPGSRRVSRMRRAVAAERFGNDEDFGGDDLGGRAEKGFYRSVRDVPEGLRQQLLRVTAGENSGTIVIADQAGKEQLTQIVARREALGAG